jgi:16S rRNA (cytosine967-C5)-methyltransferase
MANARKTVQTALLRVHREDGYSNLVWNTALEQASLDSRDAAFATSLFYGVLERQLTLDHVISAYSKTPLKKMDLLVLEALRMGVYQLLFMDAVPDRAAINESVQLVKNSRQNRLSGFVNGILRSVQRGGQTLPKMEGLSEAKRLSVTYSMPQDVVDHYINHYGEELTKELLPSFLGGRPLYLRVNTLKTDEQGLLSALQAEGFEGEPTDFPNTVKIISGGNLAATESYQKGLFHVQDPASAYCCRALDVKAGMRVLDVCAAPGGKSFTLAQLMENEGEILACDLYDHKIGLMEQGANRLGLHNITPTLRDANSSEDIGQFDRILCDLPCSGLGVLARKPEIRYKSVTFLDNFSDLQYGMLCNSLRFLKTGGVLVFSTCTLNPKENEENVARLLKDYPQLEPYPVLPQLKRVCGEESHYINLFPHIHGTDGFFISAFRKAESLARD